MGNQKHAKSKRKKRLKKQGMGLEKQAIIHDTKIKTQRGRKDTTKGYWENEAEMLRNEKLKRLSLINRKKKG